MTNKTRGRSSKCSSLVTYIFFSGSDIPINVSNLEVSKIILFSSRRFSEELKAVLIYCLFLKSFSMLWFRFYRDRNNLFELIFELICNSLQISRLRSIHWPIFYKGRKEFVLMPLSLWFNVALREKMPFTIFLGSHRFFHICQWRRSGLVILQRLLSIVALSFDPIHFWTFLGAPSSLLPP